MKLCSIPNFFNEEELEKIDQIMYSGEWFRATSSAEQEGRKTKIKWIDVNHSFLFEKIVFGFEEANKNYNFNITGVKEISILKYDTGDFYYKHMDMENHDSERKLSLIVPLSNDYEGGDTLFFTSNNPVKMPKESNIATFFPSYMIHEVTEITRGIRYSLVSWANGEYFK